MARYVLSAAFGLFGGCGVPVLMGYSADVPLFVGGYADACLPFLALLGDAENGSDGVALGGRDGDSEAVGTLGELHVTIAL